MLNFDTHAIIKQLIASGLNEPSAETIVKAIQQGNNSLDLSALSSKSDLKELKSELKIEMGNLKAELLKWSIGQTSLLLAALAAIKFFG